MTDLLPETRAFLRDWLDWVERGAPEGEPYLRDRGLCCNADRYGGMSYCDLTRHFGFGETPFGADYADRAIARTQHECPKRLAWAREHAAEREKSLSHSEGEEK